MTVRTVDTDTSPAILLVPGLGNSGPAHWQSLWEAERDDCQRVDLGMWDAPHRNSWVTKLGHAIHQSDRPVILVAHSLGCLTVAWWAALEKPVWQEKVIGALLVAPPEVDTAPADSRLASFDPAPKGHLPFPSILVASHNDPYMRFERARLLAGFWGSSFADAGEVGHINADSNIGSWDFGQFLLARLSGSAIAEQDRAGQVWTGHDGLPSSILGQSDLTI